jgi:hypothetical protein
MLNGPWRYRSKQNPVMMSPASPFERLKKAYQRFPVLFHLPAWCIYIMLPYFFMTVPVLASQWSVLALFLGVKLTNDFVSIIFFYLNYYFITPYSLRTRRIPVLLLAMVDIIGMTVLIDALYCHLFLTEKLNRIAATLPPADFTLLMENQRWGIPMPILFTTILSMLLLTSLSSGFALYRDHNQHQIQYQQVVIDKKEAELSMLKLQISPHFLFNMLNNLRWLARQKSDVTEEAILRLSEMMRYMLYQVDQGPVCLDKEIEYINNYVEIQKIRLAPNNHLQFEATIENDQVLIEPLLFIHFIENACKHGLHNELESTVSIGLQQRANTVLFTTRNPLFINSSLPNSTDSGIGIQNIERRLALHYPNRHTLNFYHKAGFFCVDLSIQLTPDPLWSPNSVASSLMTNLLR